MMSLAKSFSSKTFTTSSTTGGSGERNANANADAVCRSAPRSQQQLFSPPLPTTTGAEVPYPVLTDGDLSEPNSPTVVNNTQFPIVVFLERGILYNEQVLQPGEAVSMTRDQTGGRYLGPGGLLKIPYRVHAVIGDEKALPKKSDSYKNLARVSIVPAAFVGGCLLSASTAGTLAGPSAALARLVSGMVVKGVVIDAASIAAGTIAAERAKSIADALLKQRKEHFVCVTPSLKPGRRFLSITGGLTDGPLKAEEIKQKVFRKLTIARMKAPIAAMAKETTISNPGGGGGPTTTTIRFAGCNGTGNEDSPSTNHRKTGTASVSSSSSSSRRIITAIGEENDPPPPQQQQQQTTTKRTAVAGASDNSGGSTKIVMIGEEIETLKSLSSKKKTTTADAAATKKKKKTTKESLWRKIKTKKVGATKETDELPPRQPLPPPPPPQLTAATCF